MNWGAVLFLCLVASAARNGAEKVGHFSPKAEKFWPKVETFCAKDEEEMSALLNMRIKRLPPSINTVGGRRRTLGLEQAIGLKM